MGIFAGIEVLFYFLGVMTLLLIFGLIRLNKKYTFQWFTWVLAITAVFLFVFTIAWSASSILEGEPRAANMGLLVFGAPVLIIFGITKRLLTKRA